MLSSSVNISLSDNYVVNLFDVSTQVHNLSFSTSDRILLFIIWVGYAPVFVSEYLRSTQR